MVHDVIAVVDFGGQYAFQIASGIRRLGVLAEIRQPEDPAELFRKYKGIVISGSPPHVPPREDSLLHEEISRLSQPMIGFCFGRRAPAGYDGVWVAHSCRQICRTASAASQEGSPPFYGLDRRRTCWMSYFDGATPWSPEFGDLVFRRMAPDGPGSDGAAAFSNSRGSGEFRCRPGVEETTRGSELIPGFLFGICDCRPTWTMERFLEEATGRVCQRVGDRTVFLLVSGGVKSTVAATLLGRALGGDRLRLLHIDNGLMRANESRNVLAMFKNLNLAGGLHFVEAGPRFLNALAGVVDPAKKRSIIGSAFAAVLEEQARCLAMEDHFLGLGTTHPDTIEAGDPGHKQAGRACFNLGATVSRMAEAGRVVEPLADLYPEEVQELGRCLGLPAELVNRHPFPGPGLGVRLLCAMGGPAEDEVLRLTLKAARIVSRFNLDAVVLPARSASAQRDVRAYEHPVMLIGEADWGCLLEAAGTVLRELPGVNRCIWNLGPDPGSLRPLAATVTRERLALLREVDRIVMEGLHRHAVYHRIRTCPVVLVPMAIGGNGRELCVVRPVQLKAWEAASACKLPPVLLEELGRAILSLSGISGLAVDLTSQPPGTIEWE